MSDKKFFDAEEGIPHMKAPEDREPVVRSRAPNAAQTPCAASADLVDSCTQAQFLYWVAYDRYFNANVYPSDEQRFQCPMQQCHNIYPNLQSMLDHLPKCAYLDTGVYWCFKCWQEERLPRRTDCISKRSLLGSMRKKISNSITKSMHSRRSPHHEVEPPLSRPSSPVIPPACATLPTQPLEMFAWEGHELPQPESSTELPTPPLYEAASIEVEVAELPAAPATYMDSSSMSDAPNGPAVPWPSRQGSGYSTCSVSQDPLSLSVSPWSTMSDYRASAPRLSLVTPQTSWSETSRQSSVSLSVSMQGSQAGQITDQEMCDSPTDMLDNAGEQQGLWDKYAATACSSNFAFEAAISPLDRSGAARQDQNRVAPPPQHDMLRSFEESWNDSAPHHVQSPYADVFAELHRQPPNEAIPSWHVQPQSPYVAPQATTQDRQHQFTNVFAPQFAAAELEGMSVFPAEMEAEPVFHALFSAADGNDAASGSPVPILPATQLAVEPAHPGDASQFLGFPPAAPASEYNASAPASVKRRRLMPHGDADEPASASLQCRICKQKFQGSYVKRMFKRHLLQHNEEEVVFVCGHTAADGKVCQNCYNREDNLVQHRRKKKHPLVGVQITRMRRRRNHPQVAAATPVVEDEVPLYSSPPDPEDWTDSVHPL